MFLNSSSKYLPPSNINHCVVNRYFNIKPWILGSSHSSRHTCSERIGTMKVLLFCCVFMISYNQLQGFYIPPKTLAVYNKNCHQEMINGVVQAMTASIEAQNRNSKVQPMFYYNYPPIKPFLVKEMVDNIWKLRDALQVRKSGYNFAFSVMNRPA